MHCGLTEVPARCTMRIRSTKNGDSKHEGDLGLDNVHCIGIALAELMLTGAMFVTRGLEK